MNRRVRSNGDKAAVVLEMLRGEEPVAVICNRHSVSATQAYRWLWTGLWREGEKRLPTEEG